MSMFSAPGAPGESVDYKELNGSLLLIKVHGMETGIQTVHGVTDAARATITVLDGPQKGEEYDDALVFPRVLKSQLQRKVGELVLGRLGQGVAKPGQSAPWILNPATGNDTSVAEAHLRSQQTSALSTPGAQAPF